MIIPSITSESFAQKYLRSDIIFDVYVDDSLKAQSSEVLKFGEECWVLAEYQAVEIVFSWLTKIKQSFLTFLPQKIVSQTGDKNHILATCNDDVCTNHHVDKTNVAPCLEEEAGTRKFLHIKYADESNFKNVIVSSSDTDVVGLSLLTLDTLWIAFGRG